MSKTVIHIFNEDGLPTRQIEFKNAWRGAFAVWSNLCRKHIDRNSNSAPIHDEAKMKRIIGLIHCPEIPVGDRAVLATTLDLVIAYKHCFPKLIKHMEAFDEGMCTIPAQGKALRNLEGDLTCIAVGWEGTSVGDHSWVFPNADIPNGGEPKPYCLKYGNHYDICDLVPELI